MDRIVGLELGADDYLAKPFSPKELVARVRAVLAARAPARSASPVSVGEVSLDAARHTVTVAGRPVELTPKEFDLLQSLLEAAGRVLSREHLLNRVWGYARADEIESRTVDVTSGDCAPSSAPRSGVSPRSRVSATASTRTDAAVD